MSLLEEYVYNGLPVEVGPKWSINTIWNSIRKGPHSSTLSLESVAFCRREIMERTHWGFSIFFSMTDLITLFGTALHISRLALVDKANLKPRLI